MNDDGVQNECGISTAHLRIYLKKYHFLLPHILSSILQRTLHIHKIFLSKTYLEIKQIIYEVRLSGTAHDHCLFYAINAKRY